MSVIRTLFRRAMSASTRLLSLAAILGVAAVCGGCGPILPSQQPPPGEQAPASAADAAVDVALGEFTIAASMNDTWNTVGQVLVRTDGVTYESRAQMLGIYGLRYRGERFLIRTQAMVMRSPSDGMVTRVLALGLDGKPKNSAAAIELLEVLKERVPVEINRYTLPIEVKGRQKDRKPKRGR